MIEPDDPFIGLGAAVRGGVMRLVKDEDDLTDDERLFELPGTDHRALWEKNGGAHAFTSQSYGPLGVSTLRAWMAFAAEYGLDFHVGAYSPWNPGHTVLLVLTRKSPDPMSGIRATG